ncbi:MAG: cupin [Betaproteobacteria bacterium]|nr:cupin [Betaproteobacteria bacterium]
MDQIRSSTLPGVRAVAPGDTLESAARYGVIPVDPQTFSTHRISQIRHNFHAHPLMRLPELAGLAKELMTTGQCRFISPGCTQATPFQHRPRHPEGRAIDEVFRRIEEPGSWLALYHIETHPAYKAFLEEVTDSFRPLVEREQPGIFNVGGFMFISAPPSVTPFHIDRENNFWLQIMGRKTMNVWDHTDREVVRAADVDQFIVNGSLDNVRLKDGDLERSHEFDVGPGDGVYFPCTSPHSTRCSTDWVTPGDGISISIGVVFYTAHTRFLAYAHAWNMFLRRFGLSPDDVGKSGFIDGVKYLGGRGLVLGRNAIRGHERKAGF